MTIKKKLIMVMFYYDVNTVSFWTSTSLNIYSPINNVLMNTCKSLNLRSVRISGMLSRKLISNPLELKRGLKILMDGVFHYSFA